MAKLSPFFMQMEEEENDEQDLNASDYPIPIENDVIAVPAYHGTLAHHALLPHHFANDEDLDENEIDDEFAELNELAELDEENELAESDLFFLV